MPRTPAVEAALAEIRNEAAVADDLTLVDTTVGEWLER